MPPSQHPFRLSEITDLMDLLYQPLILAKHHWKSSNNLITFDYTPTVVASAAGLDVPNKATATATANSKKFDAPSIPAGAAISYGSLIILHTPNARKNIKNV